MEIEKGLYLEGDGRFLTHEPWESDWFKKQVQLRAEMLFYRVSEIQARAKLINEDIQPEMTLAVHFNVTPWLEKTHQELPEENHMHVIVHGTYTPGELALDDVRFHLFRKLLSRNHEIEIPLSSSLANSLAKISGLPAYHYGGKIPLIRETTLICGYISSVIVNQRAELNQESPLTVSRSASTFSNLASLSIPCPRLKMCPGLPRIESNIL